MRIKNYLTVEERQKLQHELGRIAWLGGDLLKNKGAPASAP